MPRKTTIKSYEIWTPIPCLRAILWYLFYTLQDYQPPPLLNKSARGQEHGNQLKENCSETLSLTSCGTVP